MTMPRTSLTHPLRVDFLPAIGSGRLGMTFAPGKFQPHAATGAWERDLDADLSRLKHTFATDVLVSIIEAHELRQLRIERLGTAASALGIRWVHLPVPDQGVPQDEDPWLDAIRTVRACLDEGQSVVVHCKGGLGRTGTFVAAVLTTYGSSPGDAIRTVRTARPSTIENAQQERYVAHTLQRWLAAETDS